MKHIKRRMKPVTTDIDNLTFRYRYRSIIEFIYTSGENKASKPKTTMSDLLDEDLEFRGGTLQLSTDHVVSESIENIQNDETEVSSISRLHINPNPSVLSGADSLSSSTSSFIGE